MKWSRYINASDTSLLAAAADPPTQQIAGIVESCLGSTTTRVNTRVLSGLEYEKCEQGQQVLVQGLESDKSTRKKLKKNSDARPSASHHEYSPTGTRVRRDLRAWGVLHNGYPGEEDNDELVGEDYVQNYFGDFYNENRANPQADEDDEEAVEEAEDITDIDEIDHNLAVNFNAERRRVPRIQCPFDSQRVVNHLFDAINSAQQAEYVPPGYKYFPGEHGYVEWDPRSYITVNRQDVSVTLPGEVWVPRLAQWIRGVHFLTQLLVQANIQPAAAPAIG
ncbi:hypothetical protein SISNIDRAFT_518850 [Sistotremastrum niveocremeum HHB9708]|uniref:Uncharacterized protein n=1 Tax=Sistotremastrum niveocremeum HHB9708 TaxID=1314777 RepID=A0A164RPS0_9AGAM|nr:hypothetical protein SISNIDRAFT_518850 [Sistotremastrum niveocremeum HHB9708]